MLADKLLYFSEAQAVTATAVSTNFIDFSAYRDIGTGAFSIEVFCNVDEAATAVGAATVTITLECDDNSSFSSPTTLMTTIAIPKATLVIGYQATAGWKVPAGCERYAQLRYTVATGPLTAGKFTAGLTLFTQTFRAYPNVVL